MKNSEVIKFIKSECSKNGVQCILEPSNYIVINGMGCNGCFEDSDIKTLRVATGKKESEWIPTLLHEYCHMKQCIEDIKLWKNGKVDGFDFITIIDLWLNNKIELNEKQKTRYFNNIILLEKDCEERVVKLISDMGIKQNVPLYIKKANSYILFYQVVKKYRKWYESGSEPYKNRKIWSKMPDNFDLDYTLKKKSQITLDLIKLINIHT